MALRSYVFYKKLIAILLVCGMSFMVVGFDSSQTQVSAEDAALTENEGVGADEGELTDDSAASDVSAKIAEEAAAALAKGLPAQLGITEDTKESNLMHYQQVESNEYLVFYADMTNGLFALKNKQSGKIWYSTPNDSELDEITKGTRKSEVRSQLLVHYVPVAEITTIQSPKVANSQSMCVAKDNVKVTEISGGIRAVFTFEALGLVIPVEYTLEKDYLKATLDVTHITEGNIVVITAIQLLPSFGAGNWEAQGDLFVPDGSGALIHFNNGVSSVDYDEMVYGDELAVLKESDKEQTESIHMPVFGVLTGGDALMGVITEGDAAASIAAFNGHSRSGYNAIGSKVNLRLMTNKTVFNKTAAKETLNRLTDTPDGVEAYTVRYYPLAKADYVDMAARYRHYLTEEKQLKKNPQKPALNVDLYGSIDRKAAFLGFPYTKKTALTTFEQAQEILDSLREKGIDNLAVRYLGWSNFGVLNNSIPQKASPIATLGGKKAFLVLAEYMRQNQFAFYPDVDFVRYRSGSRNDAAKTSFKEVALQYEFLRSVYATRLGLEPYQLLTPQKLKKTTAKFLPTYQKLGLTSISMSTMGDMLYSNLHPRSGTYHSAFPRWAAQAVLPYQQFGMQIAVETANAYMLPYVSRIYDAPTYSSAYDSFNAEIPFYQLVLHGYVTVTAAPMVQSMDAATNFLKAVETGSELLYAGIYAHSSTVTGTRYDNLYSATYTLWQQTAADLYKKYQPVLNAVYDKPIIAHEELAPDVMMTTYEGGYQVIVNYNKEPVNVKGRSIAAYGFEAIG